MHSIEECEAKLQKEIAQAEKAIEICKQIKIGFSGLEEDRLYLSSVLHHLTSMKKEAIK